jgi:hypothetical protein
MIKQEECYLKRLLHFILYTSEYAGISGGAWMAGIAPPYSTETEVLLTAS